MTDAYPREMVGYGQDPPEANWPAGARLAVQFVINYEEGAESNLLHGDGASEAFLTETRGARPLEGTRNMNVESDYEYGSRAGFWRLHRLFTARGLPVTVFGVAMALERNPEAIAAMLQADWEVASHGYRWIDYQFASQEMEQEHLERAVEIHQRVVGSRPLGWYTGRVSPNTRRLVVGAGGFLYDSDAYSDDLPYWVYDFGRPHLVIPYALDTNDMRFATDPGFSTGDEFLTYLRDAFDTLYEEGVTAPRMMSIGLHCRLAGRPGRTASLARFLDHVQGRSDVWICRRVEIARHWHQHHPPVDVDGRAAVQPLR
jgi:putative urate catabolism protein